MNVLKKVVQEILKMKGGIFWAFQKHNVKYKLRLYNDNTFECDFIYENTDLKEIFESFGINLIGLTEKQKEELIEWYNKLVLKHFDSSFRQISEQTRLKFINYKITDVQFDIDNRKMVITISGYYVEN